MAISPTPIRAVIFDLDDTLYPERDYIRSGYHAVGEHLRNTLGKSELFEDWLWNRFLAGQAAGAFDALSEQFSLQLDTEAIFRCVTVYREHSPVIRPFAGMPSLLAQLRPEYRMGVISDGFMPAQRLKLEATGLSRFFDEVVFTEEMGRDCWKPSPAGFEKMAAAFDLPHESMIYIADNRSKDFVAPNHLGWRTVQMLHPSQVHAHKPAPVNGSPQHVIRLPGELLKIIAQA